MRLGFPIYKVLVALLVIPALYLTFILYHSGNPLIAFVMLAVSCLGVYIYLSPRATTFRYLFPGFLGFGLFVIFPLAYTIYIGFTKYSSENLLSFERSAGLFRNETFASGGASYKYKLYAQEDGKFILNLEDDKDPARQFVSEPFELTPKPKVKVEPTPLPLTALSQGEAVKGKLLQMADINRAKLLSPLRAHQFVLPDDSIVGMAGMQNFSARERLWKENPDGTLTNKKDGNVIHPDFKLGFFVNEKGEKVGIGFRTFTGLDNYARIISDPRIQGPFLRIFLWTVAFSAISVFLSFAVGMLLAVVLEQKDLHFRRAYRTLFILPYAVPAVLSILILKGLFNQEFGAINEMLKGLFGIAPEWETNPWGARAMILLVNLWLGYPYMMLISTGMLQSIPSGIYEASAIDGSNVINDFSRLTLPLLLPPMLPILVSSFAFNLIILTSFSSSPRVVHRWLEGMPAQRISWLPIPSIWPFGIQAPTMDWPARSPLYSLSSSGFWLG